MTDISDCVDMKKFWPQFFIGLIDVIKQNFNNGWYNNWNNELCRDDYIDEEYSSNG